MNPYNNCRRKAARDTKKNLKSPLLLEVFKQRGCTRVKLNFGNQPLKMCRKR
jgi:hypothetical protein